MTGLIWTGGVNKGNQAIIARQISAANQRIVIIYYGSPVWISELGGKKSRRPAQKHDRHSPAVDEYRPTVAINIRHFILAELLHGLRMSSCLSTYKDIWPVRIRAIIVSGT